MKTHTREKIIAYIKEEGSVSSKDIAEHIGITRQALFKHLPKLLSEGTIQKAGRSPKVFYSLAKAQDKSIVLNKVDNTTRRVINERYLYITPGGEMLSGWDGFAAWARKTSQEPVKTAKEYVATLRRYDAFRKNGIIDGTKKMEATFQDFALDALYYIDFYSIERFGKTKLGQMLLYAKQSQDKKMMKLIAETMRPQAQRLIKKYHIDGVLFIPPTVKREVQFMRELEKNLRLPIRSLSVSKVKTPIIVPQKTLSKLSDRVENARETIVVEEKGVFKNILIIDDAVGSGATLNETAKKILKKGLCGGKIIGLVITGSFKGFDVISEV